MLDIKYSSQFSRDLKKLKSDPETIEKLKKVIDLLVSMERLPEKYKDHKLTGNWVGFRDCHLRPDRLLIYRVSEDLLELARVGSHSQLF